MYSKTITMGLIVVGICLLCRSTAMAQGGWDVWTIQLRDGTRLEAAPVWSLDKNELRCGFDPPGGAGKGKAVARSQISHMVNNLGNSEYATRLGASFKRPELPEGDSNEDLVVMDDGQRVSGAVMIRVGKDNSGNPAIYRPVLVQNGVETDLTRVANIKFATPKNNVKGNRPRHP